MNEFNGTPHNKAKVGEIAKVVLMPGDPLRAKFIAEKYLDNVVQFNEVRNMFGYTGDYKGKRISVMGSGMGMPSIGIYSWELYKFYGVDAIIRIGSAGAFREEAQLYDVVCASSSSSQSTYAKMQNGFEGDTIYPDEALNNTLIQSAKKLDIKMHVAPIRCGDVFYREGENNDDAQKYLAAEMESFALFHNAKVLNKKAACLVTISDAMYDRTLETTAEERQNAFTNMMEIALDTALQYA